MQTVARSCGSAASCSGRAPRPLGGRPAHRQQPRRAPRARAAAAEVQQNGAMAARVATVKRETKETKVEVTVDLDGTGKCVAESPVGFLNHMIDQIASHGLFDITVRAEGDTWIDDHHTTEDIALALGTAFSKALGDRKGIHRFGEFTAPLDEALTHVVLDLSGRPHCSCDLAIPSQKIGTFDTELVEHFFMSWANTSGTTLHIRQLAGKNSHHIVEATFKAFARALRRAAEYDERRRGQIASSKGVLTQQ
jgi:imidazoleglycerol-phosphate dehydratase